MNQPSRQEPFALLAVGELLADFIGHTLTTSLRDAQDFRRYQGGSPANMAANMARLGNRTALVSCVGADNLGRFLTEQVAAAGVETAYIQQDSREPTSIVLVSRTKGTPDFIAYRTADRMLQPDHLPDSLLSQSRIFHTTCFALSQAPAQATLVDAARRAHQLGCQVSIDANYAPSLWPDRAQAWQVLGDYCSAHALVKLSEDDAMRLYGVDDVTQLPSHEAIVGRFHELGASLVCLTLGADGSLISSAGGSKQIRVLGQPVNVVDATGAGDAYWAGFLTAYLDGHTPEACAGAGARLAQMKLERAGPLPDQVDRALLY
ncbi:carbohydrate kinase [Spirosoma luteolum]